MIIESYLFFSLKFSCAYMNVCVLGLKKKTKLAHELKSHAFLHFVYAYVNNLELYFQSD
jgi:hypothetical protein